MNSITSTTKKIDPKVLLSTLWIVIMFNMLYADILGLFIPGSIAEMAKTAANVGATIPLMMLIAAVMGNLSIVMIVLSRVLKYGVSRWANIIVGIITIVYIWGGMSTYPHYLFIASVETICLVLIIWNALKWQNLEA